MGAHDTTLVERLRADDALLEKALEDAAREAYVRHKREGHPIIIWEDGQIVRVPAEEIVVPPKDGK